MRKSYATNYEEKRAFTCVWGMDRFIFISCWLHSFHLDASFLGGKETKRVYISITILHRYVIVIYIATAFSCIFTFLSCSSPYFYEHLWFPKSSFGQNGERMKRFFFKVISHTCEPGDIILHAYIYIYISLLFFWNLRASGKNQ